MSAPVRADGAALPIPRGGAVCRRILELAVAPPPEREQHATGLLPKTTRVVGEKRNLEIWKMCFSFVLLHKGSSHTKQIKKRVTFRAVASFTWDFP